VATNRKNEKTQSLIELAKLKPDDFVMVAGSTQPGESLLVAKIYQKLVAEFSNLRLVLVPRHPETCLSVRKVLESSGLSVKMRSKINTEQPAGADVILVDVIGELSAWWGCANVAFVGGSMGGTLGANRGGQNMIEPAAYGVPVSFGPDTRNFRSIVTQLLDADAATVVDDEQALTAFFRQVITEPAWAIRMGAQAQKLVTQHSGASERTVSGLMTLLGPNDNDHPRAA
jgi:3-deoxy-D-manno-octulosonic-acid transferase